MNSLYKKGDTVLIKSQYDKGCRSTSYRFIFVDYMLKRYGGKVCTIWEEVVLVKIIITTKFKTMDTVIS